MNPIVSWYVGADGSCMVFMHSGTTIRSFSSPSVVAAQRTIVSVAISEFGVENAEAAKLAAVAVAQQMKVADVPENLSEHMQLLAAAQAGKAAAENQVRGLQQQLAAANARIAGLERPPLIAPAPVTAPAASVAT
jgi:hypothetical protein